MAKEVPQLVKGSLRAVLLSQKGIKQTAIEKDYHKLTNSKLDFKKYGFQDLYEFLLAVPDVARLEYSAKDGENRVFGVAEKGVFMSEHAKKAMGKPTGLKPLPPSEWPRNKASKERTVVESKSSLKVTVESGSKRKIVPNARGLYALHIKNLPPSCQQNDVNRIFKKFKSLAEVKIDSSSSKRAAFVRFSNHTDAVTALSEMDGYNLQGFSLIINPDNERPTKASKAGGEECKVEATKKKENNFLNETSNSVMENKEVNSGKSMKNPSTSRKVETKTVAAAENWESEGKLWSPKSESANNKFFGQDNLAENVFKMNCGYPIHVSNFPPGSSQSTLKQIFSGCGEIASVEVYEKFAFIYYTKKEEAVTALQTMQNKVKLGEKVLTVTPRTLKGKSAGAAVLGHGSSHSSISSCDSSAPQSPVKGNFSDTAGFDVGDTNNQHTHTGVHSRTTVKGYRELDQISVGEQLGRKGGTPNTSKDVRPRQEERSLNGQRPNTRTESCAKDSQSTYNAEPHISVNSKQRVPVHRHLTYEEMSKLAQLCKKPFRTASNIGFEEFDILVTDVVDSCHFWANVDDKIGSYKKLEQVRADLQTMEHHKQCMPVKHQLGAALYSEDNQWYRCWCLEVTSLQKKEALVFYLDYGNCEWISWEQFTDIEKKFWDLAPQAVSFKLAGLEHAKNVTPDVLNEGSKYLSDLICNKVCHARKTKPSDTNKPHITEVELILNDASNTSVNGQMALTRYVEKTATKGTIQSPSSQESIPSSHRLPAPQQPKKHIPPHPLMKSHPSQATRSATPVQHSTNQELQAAHPAASRQWTTSQDLHATHSATSVEQSTSQELQATYSAASVQQATSQELLPAGKHLEPFHAQSTPSPFRSPKGGQGGFGQESPQDAKLEPSTKSHQGTFQHQQSLPDQLFEKKEVIKIFLSYVGSPDDISFFLADEETNGTLFKIHSLLKRLGDPDAAGCKIYPREGDVVVKASENRRFRVKIISIPSTATGGIDKVVVKGIDYGRTEIVPLSTLYELPQCLRDIPPQAKQARLAGLRKKQGMKHYPDGAASFLISVKRKREVVQASIIRREQNGLCHVELFEALPSLPSLNVQLVKKGYAEVDLSQCPLPWPNPTSTGSDYSKSSDTQRCSNNMTPSAVQNSGWNKPELTERKLDMHQWDTHSVHSDWEDNLLEIEEDWSDTGSQAVVNWRQSKDQLYVPPPPETVRPSSSAGSASSAEIRPSPAAGSVNSLRTSPIAGLTNISYPDTCFSSSPFSSSALPDITPEHYLARSVGSTNLDVLSHSTAEPESHALSDVRPPSPSTTGSDSSGVYSDASLNSLLVTETLLNREDKPFQDSAILPQSVEINSVEQDWRQEREELIQKDEELKRILEMPKEEMKKMISLKQQKEKLERKIRIKRLENQILKLQRELEELEVNKGELEEDINC